MAKTPRELALEKYGGGSSAPVKPTEGNSVRASLKDKYLSAGVGSEPSIVDDMALKPGETSGQTKTVVESPRASMLDKYKEPKVQNAAPAQGPSIQDSLKKLYPDLVTDTEIASPEYFSNSVSVRSPEGKYVDTFESDTPGEAASKARARAAEVGGFVENTPAFGFLGKMGTRIKEAVTGAFENVGKKGDELITELDSRNPEATPISRAAKMVDLGTAGVEAFLSPISSIFAGGEEIPVAGKVVQLNNYIFGKAGELGGWASDQVVDNIPYISEKTREDIREPASNLSSLLSQIALGKATGEVYKKTANVRAEIKTKIFKDIIVENNLPQTINVSPEKIKSIFSDGKLISPAEAQMVAKLFGEQATDRASLNKLWDRAIKEGVNIEIPTERITTIIDKPLWAKVKGAFGIAESAPEVVRQGGQARPGVETRPERLLSEKGVQRPVIEPISTPESIQPARTALPGEMVIPRETLSLPPTVKEALASPITPSLVDRISNFDEVESSAFGKKIIQNINEAIGTKITDQQAFDIPENVRIFDREIHVDGRPAQFKNGQIEISMPALVGDLKKLAEGGEILAHPGGNAEFMTVYKKNPGETMEQLSVRYIKDVLLHEAAHGKTMNLADETFVRDLNTQRTEARLKQDRPKLLELEQTYGKHMIELEDRANAYLRDNRVALEKEVFAKRIPENKKFEKAVTGEKPQPRITKTEPVLLKDRIKNIARGAREGYRAGRDVGKKEIDNKSSQQLEDTKRAGELKSLKENIIARTGFEKATERINDRNATVESRRTALIEYSQLLPFRERGKFLKAIENTKSEKDFRDVLDRMRREARLADRRVLIQEISKELKSTIIKKQNGLPNVKFAAEQQRALNTIRAFQKNMTYQNAQIEIANKISAWKTAHPDENVPIDLIREIDLLKTADIKSQTVAELSNTLATVKSLKETGRTAKELEKFNKETEIGQEKDKILDTITGGKPLPSDKKSLKSRETRAGVLQQTKQFLTSQQYGFEEVLDVLSENDKSSKPYESFLSKYAGDKVNEAFNTQNKGELAEISKISDTMKKIYDVETPKQVMEVIGDLKEVKDLGEIKHADGSMKKLEISRGEAIQMRMWQQDPTLLETFSETLNWGKEVQDAVNGILTEADKKMGDALLEFYRGYYEGVNKVFLEEFGIDLPFNENYSPVHRAVETSIPENVLLAQEAAKYATAKNGSLKERVKNKVELKPVDAFENVMRHLAKMEHYKAWSDPMNRFRQIFGDKQVRQAITDFHGKEYMTVLDNFLNDFARDGVSREKLIPAIDALRGNVTKALLGANIRVGLKQLTGVMNYGIELPTKDFVTGIADFWKAPLANAEFLYDNSGVLQDRFGDGFERDIKYAISKGYDKKLAGSKNLSEMLFIPIRNADKFTVYMGSHAAYKSGYNEAIAAGKSVEEAQKIGIRKAENVTNRIQESSRIDTLSPLQRGGSLAKLFTMFANQPAKYLRVMMNAGRNYRAGRSSGPAAAKRIAWAWFVVPFIYNMVANRFVDEKYRDNGKGLVTKTLLGPLSYPLIVGQMVQQIYGWTGGENFAYSPSPAFSFMDDIQKAIQNFQQEDMIDATTYLVDALGKAGGVPTTIATKPIRKGAKDAE